jgi:hypothetical protein
MVAQLVKGLKPKKLRIDKVRLNILNELRAEGRIIKKEFEKTTTTWKGAKPTFKIAIGLTGQDAIVIVGPAGDTEGAQKWVWLDEGTKPHVIKAKNVPNLKFRTNFTPKTKVKTFSSRKGSIKPPWRSTPQVRHPGIEARDWTGEIAKRRRKPFTKRIIKASRV